MHRRLGEPLPHQPANAPQVHPCAEPCSSFNTESMPSLSLSGISFRFRKFSRSHGQVPYVLLTRSPLESRRTLVRLACIRHAASVHPEPGSNSPFDSTLFFQCLFADIFFFFLFVFLFRCFSRNRRVCFFSLVLVRLIFCFFRFYQVFKDRPAVCFQTACLYYFSFSRSSTLVLTFLTSGSFSGGVSLTLTYHTALPINCQLLFISFLKEFR